jgi:hypothetical protein
VTAETAERILVYYFAVIARKAGLRWSTTNTTEIRQAFKALAGAEPADAGDTIPPFLPAVPAAPEQERVTVELERDPQFDAWRAERRQSDGQDSVRRMLAREDSREVRR